MKKNQNILDFNATERVHFAIYRVKGGLTMDDKKIIEMFFARDEGAIKETEKKYGKLCRYIASNILASREDSEVSASSALSTTPSPLVSYMSSLIKLTSAQSAS